MLSPAETPQLVGHSLQQSHFLETFCSNRFPHGWILSGQKGIGKATFAFTMARYILSSRSNSNTTFDPQDPVFRRVASRSHGDLLVIEREEGKQDITIDQARKLPKFFSQTTAEGGWRVVIIDEAERMNRSTMNATLKSLEEPPEKTVLFLITQTGGRLLPTITSRCKTLTFSPLQPDQMNQAIADFGLTLPTTQLQSLLTYAGGSPGKLVDLAAEAAWVHQLANLLASLPFLSIIPALPLLKRGWLEEKAFDIIEHMTLETLHTQVEKNVRGEKCPLSLEQSLGLWEKATRLFQECRHAQLDHKATLYAVFTSLEKDHL